MLGDWEKAVQRWLDVKDKSPFFLGRADIGEEQDVTRLYVCVCWKRERIHTKSDNLRPLCSVTNGQFSISYFFRRCAVVKVRAQTRRLSALAWWWIFLRARLALCGICNFTGQRRLCKWPLSRWTREREETLAAIKRLQLWDHLTWQIENNCSAPRPTPGSISFGVAHQFKAIAYTGRTPGCSKLPLCWRELRKLDVILLQKYTISRLVDLWKKIA